MGVRELQKEGRGRRLILLELSPEDERAVAVWLRAQLLHAADALDPLWTPALRDDDVDLETITDLRKT